MTGAPYPPALQAHLARIAALPRTPHGALKALGLCYGRSAYILAVSVCVMRRGWRHRRPDGEMAQAPPRPTPPAGDAP